MSWDLYAQDFPPVASVEDIPEDFDPQPLGPRDTVILKIRAVLPDVDFSDPGWGLLRREGWSIEFNLGNDAECSGVSLYVRGGGADAMEVVDSILHAIGARGIDLQTSRFFTLEAARKSFGTWQDYRDQVVAEYAPAPKRGLLSRLFGK
ncbi:hypothetical protein ACQKOH_15320 [Sphingomonas sp. NPDC092331]|jgi:hypothetical protein|uniref:hypothetical protein n=1 Tax=unclassified Sphingomonas TaxID=196159 RepID=UPI0029F0541F|nr:hypothetical protein [Pseudomonadota bacterium]